MMTSRSVEFSVGYQSNDGQVTALKMVVVGDPMVGKTSTLNALQHRLYDQQNPPTIGIDVRFIHAIVHTTVGVTKDSTGYRLQMWDCAGQARFKSIVASYFRMAHIIVFMFDLTDRESFTHIRDWYAVVQNRMDTTNPFVHSGPEYSSGESPDKSGYITFLVGNKVDAKRDRVVDRSEATELAQSLGTTGYFELSARSSINVQETFEAIVLEAHDAVRTGAIRLPQRMESTIQLERSREPREESALDCIPFSHAQQCNIL